MARRVGIWLVGAFGAVGSTVALGVAAMRRGLCDTTGLVTALPQFGRLELDDPTTFVVGGHDLVAGNFVESAARVGGGTPAFAAAIIAACRPELDSWSGNVCPAVDWAAAPVTDHLALVEGQLKQFVAANRLDQVVVVNVASTEPPPADHPAHHDGEALAAAIDADARFALGASSWYACAALRAGVPYINFTPSCGASLPGLEQLAVTRRVPIGGQDGKTGETLLKTVLAPMFANRNLRVLSWVGHNILGNNDGRVLSDPVNRAAKLKNKDRVVADLLGYAPQTLTTIEFIESQDDWKTAWDHIHFAGFLGVRMTCQLIWQGCDSALAAPLVLDLARLALHAQRRGEAGVLKHLAVFFKQPMGVAQHDLAKQFAMLEAYANS